MSPSAGLMQRLTTMFTKRWFIAIMMPRPGTTSTSWQPAMAAMRPAHGPPAFMTKRQSMRLLPLALTSRTVTPTTRSSARWTATTSW